MLNRLMTRKEQLTLLFVAVAIIVGGVAFYVAPPRGSEEPLARVDATVTPSENTSTPTAGETAASEAVSAAVVPPSPRQTPPEVEAESVEPDLGVVAVPLPNSAPQEVAVAVMGAVANEGLYRVPADTRLGDLLDRAGGALESADLSDINLGARVIDGTTLTLPERRERYAPDGSVRISNTGNAVINPPSYTRSQSAYLPPTTPGAPAASPSNAPAHADASRSGPVNLNTATQAELEALPGIGPAYAQRIIERRAQGAFTRIEDLDSVPGIGPKRLEQLRPYVTVE